MAKSKEFTEMYEELIDLRKESWDKLDYYEYYINMMVPEDIEDLMQAHDEYIWHTYDIDSLKESLECEKEEL